MSELKEIRDNVKSIKVLYVEDEKEVREQTLSFFHKIFDNIDTAVNGLEGVELFEKNSYDLVITDLKMPKMDGREMLAKIHEINKDIIAIVMTASDSNMDATQTQCNAYLYKPVSFVDLLEALRPLQSKLLKQ